MNIKALNKTALFMGLTDKEIESCLSELKAAEKSYKKDSLILHAGDVTEHMGLVLSGSVTVESNDRKGKKYDE